jgi:hypothetical protein
VCNRGDSDGGNRRSKSSEGTKDSELERRGGFHSTVSPFSVGSALHHNSDVKTGQVPHYTQETGRRNLENKNTVFYTVTL